MKKIILTLLPVAAVLMSCAAPKSLDVATAKNVVSAINDAHASESFVVPTQMTFEQTTYAEESLNGEKETEEVYTLMSVDVEKGYFHVKSSGGETWGYVEGTDYYLAAETESGKKYGKLAHASEEEAVATGLEMMGMFGLGQATIQNMASQPEMLQELEFLLTAFENKDTNPMFEGYDSVELTGSASGTSIEATFSATMNMTSSGMTVTRTTSETIKFEDAKFVKAHMNNNQTMSAEGQTMTMTTRVDINVSYTCNLVKPSLEGFVEDSIY